MLFCYVQLNCLHGPAAVQGLYNARQLTDVQPARQYALKGTRVCHRAALLYTVQQSTKHATKQFQVLPFYTCPAPNRDNPLQPTCCSNPKQASAKVAKPGCWLQNWVEQSRCAPAANGRSMAVFQSIQDNIACWQQSPPVGVLISFW